MEIRLNGNERNRHTIRAPLRTAQPKLVELAVVADGGAEARGVGREERGVVDAVEQRRLEQLRDRERPLHLQQRDPREAKGALAQRGNLDARAVAAGDRNESCNRF